MPKFYTLENPAQVGNGGPFYSGMAKLPDALVLGTSVEIYVWVEIPLPLPFFVIAVWTRAKSSRSDELKIRCP